MNDPLAPTRAAGLQRLAAFAPRMGRMYEAGRNFDRGSGAGAVSGLSPYLRRRLVLEDEAVAAARAAHGAAADKFVEEVFWRTYWKGFLQQHPSIWTTYQRDVLRGWDRLAVEGGLRDAFTDATAGATGIDCFDAWARELVISNTLHNHARMWFASIWIFTLRLPWALGADFFARHLLDGDPASNTLSWRWVAGLHTVGKPYVARAENIARYTDGRFHPLGQLDEAPAPLTEPPHPAVPLDRAEPAPAGDVALLLHEDDLGPLPELGAARVGVVAGFASAGFAHQGPAAPLAAFASGALADALERAEACRCPVLLLAPEALADWVLGSPIPVVTPFAPIGPVAELLRDLPVIRVRRPWDTQVWPHARRGFFHLRERMSEFG